MRNYIEEHQQDLADADHDARVTTPGPWKAEGHTVRHADGTQIALVNAYRADQRGESNARLLAAAPSLLDALRNLNHMGGDERGGYCICPIHDGSAPDEKHATACSDARRALAATLPTRSPA
jgi:hypothetical protein